MSLDGRALEEPSVAGQLAATPHSSLSSQSINHSTFFELIPTNRLTSEHVYRELQWARTTRQPYDLIVLDESAPKLDTVKVLVAMNKRNNQPINHSMHHSSSEQSLGQAGKLPSVLILTTRLLSPILRGNGVSTYVLISKPVLLPDLSRALTLLLKEQHQGINQSINQSHSMPVVGRRLEPSQAAKMHAIDQQDIAQSQLENQMDNQTINSTISQLNKPYVSSSRRPKEDGQSTNQSLNQSTNPSVVSSLPLHLLHEPVRLHQLDRQDHLITSEPASPLDQSIDQHPHPHPPSSSRAIVQSYHNTHRSSSHDDDAGILPSDETQAEIFWNGRAQSMPDYVQYNQSTDQSINQVAPETIPSSKPRSKSVHNVFFPFDDACSLSSPSDSEAERSTNQPINQSRVDDSSQKSYEDAKVDLEYPDSARRSPRESFSGIDASINKSTGPLLSDLLARDKNFDQDIDRWVDASPRSLSSSSVSSKQPVKTARPLIRRVLPSSKAGDSTSSPRSPSLGHQSNNQSGHQSGHQSRSNSSASSTSSSTAHSPSVYSPLASASPLASTNKQSMSAPSRVRLAASYQVLVVDDNLINLKVASKMLTRLGYDCITATNGQDAIARIEKQKLEYVKPQEYPEFIRGRSAESDLRTQVINQSTPDRANPNHWIVLMDIQMDGMNGHETTRRIRQLGHTMPIIALTGNCTAEDRELCIQSGMQAFLGKPLLMESLEKALKQAIETIQEKWESEKAKLRPQLELN